MDMDDHKDRFQIDPGTKIVVGLIVLLLVGLSALIYLYTGDKSRGAVNISNQFKQASGLMRHTYKVSMLTTKASDTFLLSIMDKDENELSRAMDYLKASLGFIHVDYIDNRLLLENVVPVIASTLLLLEERGLSVSEEEIAQVLDGFGSILRELDNVEKLIYEELQLLYERQLAAEKRLQLFYLLLVATAILGFVVIAFLAARQWRLIARLRKQDHKLRIHMRMREKNQAEKEKLTEQLHQAKKMESIGLMAGGVAHDLNNILSGIVGYPELLLMSLPDTSDLRKPIEAMRDSGKRAALVVEDLLTVARGAASHKEDHNLSVLAKEYFLSPEFETLQSIHPEIIFERDFSCTDCWVYCSPIHVKKSLMNLVTNGAEAISGAGTLRIQTGVVHSSLIDDDTRKFLEDGEYTFLSVSDTGGGIPEADLNHIFDPFYSKKVMGRSGTGLGLTVVWNTMKDHNGAVAAMSDEYGAVFSLYFPLGSKRQNEPVGAKVDKVPRGEGQTILVVDDEAQLRDISTSMLNSLGYRVEAVSSGEEALAVLEQKQVDLLMLDMLMDPGLNGLETYEQAVHLHPGQKAIIVSGFSESELVREAKLLGASRFMKKPYTIENLGAAVRDALSS